MRVKRSQLSAAGDTIVEVMIVLTVLGLAISISYATANRSLLNARQAQENSYATNLLQSQLEALRVLSPNPITPANQYIYQPYDFCVNTTNPSYIVVKNTTTTCQFGPNGWYKVTISYNQPANDLFILRAVWPDVRGDGQDSVQLSYRLHPQL